MNNLPNIILLERIEGHPFLARKLHRFMSKSFSIIRQIRQSDLPDKDTIMKAYIFHRSHQIDDINMSMLDDATKHEIHCRVMALLMKKVVDNES
jgi:hypothetical protein